MGAGVERGINLLAAVRQSGTGPRYCKEIMPYDSSWGEVKVILQEASIGIPIEVDDRESC
jgi:hypothetical protein